MSWVRASLGHLVSFGNGQDASGVIEDEGANPVYGSGGEFARTNAFLYEGPSILFGRKGTVDKPRFVDGKFWTIDTVYYAVPEKNVDPKFLYYWATTIPFETLMTNTARPSMTAADLSRLPVDLPPLEEQRRIADYLDAETTEVDAMSAQLDELVGNLRERRASMIAEALDLGVKCPVGLVCSLRAGATPPTTTPSFWSAEGGTPWVSIRDMSTVERVSSTTKSLTREGLIASRLTPAPVGTVLFAMYASVGETAILETEAVWNQALIGLTPTDASALDSRFLYLSLTSLKPTLPVLFRSNTQNNLNAEQVKALRIPLPPLDEQRRIVARLDAEAAKIDAMIADATRLKELIAERRSALITEVVTGRKQV